MHIFDVITKEGREVLRRFSFKMSFLKPIYMDDVNVNYTKITRIRDGFIHAGLGSHFVSHFKSNSRERPLEWMVYYACYQCTIQTVSNWQYLGHLRMIQHNCPRYDQSSIP